MVILNFFSLLILLFSASCCTTEPQLEPKLTLELKDVSCTEAWLQFSSTNIQIPNNFSLLINNTVAKTFSLSTQDSLLYIDSLLPNQSYKFKIVINTTNNPQPTTNEVLARTMDTTSHNFTWQTFEFGQHSSSVLYDVAIINENNIWAVGEIYMNDSLGNPDPIAYNAINWNGSEWKPKKINVLFRGNIITPPLEGVFAFSSTDIWFVGSLPIHGNGTNWILYDLRTTVDPNLSFSKAWGISSNDMYFVGRSGSIAHYQNGGWNKIESGTELDINDIWGDYNGKIGELEILAVASNILQSNEKEVIKVNTNATQLIDKTGIKGTLSSVWFNNKRKYFVAGGGGVSENKSLDHANWQKSNYNFTKYLYRIRGTELNDISASGGFGDVLHFNGVSWKSYFNETQLNNGNYYSIAINSSLIITVGQDNPRAVIKIGRR